MNEDKIYCSFGAKESPPDIQHVNHDDLVMGLMVPAVWKIDYTGYAHKNQMTVGICTAACVTTLAEKFFGDGVRLSMEWLYKMGKVLVDQELSEGSSIFTMLKVAQKYGIPTEVNFPSNCNRSYKDFMSNVTITQAMLDDAALHKIPGYAQVPVNADSLMKAIYASNCGVATRWAVGKNWYTKTDGSVSYDKKDLDPLRAPNPVSGGHAISHNAYDNSATYVGGLRNSWGDTWCDNGDIHFWLEANLPYFTEAWVILGTTPIISQTPTLRRGSVGSAVKDLQTKLNKKNSCNLGIDGVFGQQTLTQVIYFQTNSKLVSDGIVGPATWLKLNLP